MSIITSAVQRLRDAVTRRGPSTPDAQPIASEEERPEPILSTQIEMSAEELHALGQQVWYDRQAAHADHTVRLLRHRQEEKLWRDHVGLSGGEEGKSNFRVQLIEAICGTKLARESDALFGNLGGITATPRGPSDADASDHVGRFLDWQVFENMDARLPMTLWILRRLKHGRSFAFVPHESKFYRKKVNGKATWVKYKEGPQIYPLSPDDIMLPPSTDGRSCGWDNLQQADWVHRRYWATPTDIYLQASNPGEESSPHQDWYNRDWVTEHWNRLLQIAKTRYGLDQEIAADGVRRESTAAQGIQPEGAAMSRVGQIEIIEAHMRWHRWAKKKSKPTETSPENQGGEVYGAGSEINEQSEFDITQPGDDVPTFTDQSGQEREIVESRLIVRWCVQLKQVMGVQDADELYPDTPTKIPIMEMALQHDGQYWCKSLIEMILDIESELTILANNAIEAGDMTIWPPLLARPSMGDQLATRKYEKGDIIWTEDPAGAKTLEIRPNMETFAPLWQMLMTLQEMLTGITQMSMGRSMDQPNAPRTLGGQRLLSGATDLRLALDMGTLHEYLRDFIAWVWDLSTMFGSEELFFRVAEGDSGGRFKTGDVKNGFYTMKPEERQGKYDFSFEFADDAQIREGKKQEALALLQAAMLVPTVQQDPVAQYRILVEVFKAFGKDYTAIASQPPPPFNPMTPEHEWTLMLEGQKPSVHPQDDDQAHITDHENRFQAMFSGPPDQVDDDALWYLKQHIDAHKKQLTEKQHTQELMQGIQGILNAAQIGAAGGHPNPLQAMLGAVSQAQQNQAPQGPMPGQPQPGMPPQGAM